MSETKQNEENGRGEVTKKEVYRGIEIYTRSTFDGKDTIFFISDKYGNTPVTRSISEIKKIIDEIQGTKQNDLDTLTIFDRAQMGYARYGIKNNF